MKIAERQHGAVVVITLTGSLSGADAEQVKNRLLQAMKTNRGRFVMDAAEIAFIDGTGLEMLLDINDETNRIGRALKICAAGETIRRIMELTGVAPLFEQFSDANEAVRSFL